MAANAGAGERETVPPPARPLMTHRLDPFFESYYRLRPVNATFTGMHAYDRELPDWSTAGLSAAIAEMSALRAGLHPVAPSPATVADSDVALADAFLEIQIAEMEGPHFQRGNPALWTGEAIFGLLSLMLRDFAPAPTRAGDLAERLRRVPAFLAAFDTTCTAPVPPLWRTRAERECDAAVRLLGRGIPEWTDANDLSPPARTDLADALPAATRAFETFRAGLAGCRAADARGGCGGDFYGLLLERGHWCAEDARALLTQATAELDAARGALSEMLRKHGRDWAAAEAELASLHPPADGYLLCYRDLWQQCRTAAETHALLTWPADPPEYVPIPAWARDVAPDLYFLFYRSPAPFDATPPQYLVPPLDGLSPDRQTALLRAVNTYVIKTNHVAHHGAIGHHVQNTRAYHSPSRIGQVAAVDCASRIGMFGGGSLAEGWACYATDLMEEVGFLTDLERIAHQHARVRQLLRAVLDVRVHVEGLPVSEAVRVFATGTGLTDAAAGREITRLTMFPGTSIMYWLGTRAIHHLRADHAAREGAAFSLRGFHDKFLGYGALPVRLIAHLMQGESA